VGKRGPAQRNRLNCVHECGSRVLQHNLQRTAHQRREPLERHPPTRSEQWWGQEAAQYLRKAVVILALDQHLRESDALCPPVPHRVESQERDDRHIIEARRANLPSGVTDQDHHVGLQWGSFRYSCDPLDIERTSEPLVDAGDLRTMANEDHMPPLVG
jgi:hypothetical protein